ncbi:nucleoporin-62 C-terminal-like protein [Alligator mississippiensis]|uniref:nucleoporin-62 C-terminal-like protein n=1 Tax=Alligator mississippiensis TaxID=8496 RepID=UPI002877DFB3|nr:nucleoporin-62 C-terminal-like protein [Alligator mississippiensis]
MSQFNFGSSAPGGGFSFGAPKGTAASTAAPAAPAPAGFSFSAPGAGAGFSFGIPAPAPSGAQPAGLFSLPAPATSAPTAGFSFGAPATATATPAPAGNVFSLGGNAPKLNLGSSGTTQTTGITGGFGLGSSAPSSAPSSQAAAPSGFVFGCTTAATTTTTTHSGSTGGFNFSTGGATQTGAPNFSIGPMGSTTQQAMPTGLSFGAIPAAASTAATTAATIQPVTAFSLGVQSAGLNFGMPTSTPATSAPTGALVPTTSQGPTLSFGAKPGGLTATSTAPIATTTTTTASLLGSSGPTLFASIASSSAPASSAATGLSLGATSTGTSTLGTLGFGLKVPGTTTSAAGSTTSTTSAPNLGFALNLKPLTTTGTIGAVTSTATVTTTTTSTPPVMTYAQLESLINKWSLELEDQEKHFLQQATQVNAWDRTLIENGEKITSLHREVEKVKLDQKRLDQELDFILSQQKELEDLLTPLEESVKEQSGTIYLQHADEERERTYKLAENIDAQLKRMAQDLKDIIEHLNTSGGPADTSDPLQQICKILNAHMDSLQWIDQNSALLQRKVEEVTKVCESRRKEQERSFRITFD